MIKNFTKIIQDQTWWNPKIKKEDYLNSWEFPIIDQWQQFVWWYTDDKWLLCKVGLPCIIFWDHTRIFKYVDFPFAMWADWVKVLKCGNEVDTKYAYYFLKQSKLWGKQWYNRNFKYLKEVNIPLPPLATQRAIADKLDKLQSLIDLKRQAITKTDELAKSIFLEMFGKDNYKISSFGDKNTIEIIDWDRGKMYPKSDDFLQDGYCRFLNTSNVRKGYFNFDKMDFVSEQKDKELRKWKLVRGDVVLTTRWTVGNIAYYGEDIPQWNVRINSWMVLLRPNVAVLNPKYLVKYLMSDNFEEQKIRQQSGSAQPQLPITVLRNIEIPLPPLPFQQKFSDIITQIESQKSSHKLALAKLEELYQAEMQESFNNPTRSENPNDLP